jgi:hypothetical protein
VSKVILPAEATAPPTPEVLRVLLDAWGVVLEGGPVTAMAFAPVGESFPTVLALGHSGRELNAAKIKAKVVELRVCRQIGLFDGFVNTIFSDQTPVGRA